MFTRFKWSDTSGRRNRMTALYEPVQPFLFCAFAHAIGTREVFDIGANIGQYSLFAQQVPGVARIHSFEAEAEAFAQLEQNISLNELQALITPHFKAVSNKAGEVTFAVAGPMAGNNAIASTTIHKAGVYKEERTVPAIRLDDEYAMRDTPLCFKVDVEGHEYQVLEGAETLLRSNPSILQVELYRDANEVTARLHGYGYRRIFNAGVDFYFSNAPELATDAQVLKAIEAAMVALIRYTRKG